MVLLTFIAGPGPLLSYSLPCQLGPYKKDANSPEPNAMSARGGGGGAAAAAGGGGGKQALTNLCKRSELIYCISPTSLLERPLIIRVKRACLYIRIGISGGWPSDKRAWCSSRKYRLLLFFLLL